MISQQISLTTQHMLKELVLPLTKFAIHFSEILQNIQ